MGLDARVIAIGPYSDAVSNALEYGSAGYADVTPGAVVVSNIFIAETSESSRRLALAFGVGEMELGKHKLDPGRACIALLTEIFGEFNVAQFQCLAGHGFSFYYLPNA